MLDFKFCKTTTDQWQGYTGPLRLTAGSPNQMSKDLRHYFAMIAHIHEHTNNLHV